MVNVFRRIFTPNKRKEKVRKFADLLNEVKMISSVYQCGVAMKAVMVFREGLSENDELYKYTGNLVEFIIDTRAHARFGHHKSAKTKWETSTKYPDINDYFNFSFKIKTS